MATMFRRPFALAGVLAKDLAPASRSAIRQFQTTTKSSAPIKPSSQIFTATRQTAFLKAFRQPATRAYHQPVLPNYANAGANLTSRLLYGGAIFGGTLLAINLVFNRETREDGGMPPYERAYLNETFLHTGLGVGIIGVAARALHTSGWSYRLMATNPWIVLGVGLVGSMATLIGCRMTSPDNYMLKYGLWTGFNLTQAMVLSPLFFFSPAILGRAGLYTVGIMGSIAFVGATAKQDKYLYLGGPLLAGVAVVALSGLAPMVLPATATRALMWTENIWLYGGLAVFAGFTLYDVQKILAHARMAHRGLVRKDVVNEAISLELDFINIFVRLVQLLAMQQGRRK